MSHNSVAGILKRDGACNVVELDWRERLVEVCAANVERRLLVANRAGLVSGIGLPQRSGPVLPS